MTLAENLPAVNALMNAISAGLLLGGWRAARAGDRDRHRALMLAALGSSALFLVGYLTRVALTGTHRFPVGGAWRTGYLLLLGSHTILAALVVPLILRAVWLGWHGRVEEHRRIARVTMPTWLYVSVTGVLVYLMLYQVAPRLG